MAGVDVEGIGEELAERCRPERLVKLGGIAETDDDMEVAQLRRGEVEFRRLGSAQVFTPVGHEVDHIGLHGGGSLYPCSAVAPAVGELLAGDGRGQGCQTGIVIINEQYLVDLFWFGLPGGKKYSLLAEIFGLVGDALQPMVDDENGKPVLQGPAVLGVEKLLEHGGKRGLDFFRHGRGSPGHFNVGLVECLHGLLQYMACLVGHQLDAPGGRSLRRRR